MFGFRVALLTTAISACESPTPEPLAELDEAEFNLRYATVSCRSDAVCGPLDRLGYDSEEECIEDGIAWWELGRMALADYCPDATYSPSQAAACLDFYSNTTDNCETAGGLCADMEWYQDSCRAFIYCYHSEEGCM